MRYNGVVTGFSRHCKSLLVTVNFFDIAWGNNPMVGATVACAVAVEEAMK